MRDSWKNHAGGNGIHGRFMWKAWKIDAGLLEEKMT